MKRIPWIFLLISLSVSVTAQRNADFGIFGGVSSYIGDINTTRMLYSPLPAGGLFYRYNIHPRNSVRASLFFGGLHGDDLDFNNSFQINRGEFFSGSGGELAIQYEFNFLPYSTFGKPLDFSPYFAAGAGVAFLNTVSPAVIPVIPFSLGFKINIYKNLGLEAEYGFRKTFYDNIDGVYDPVASSDAGWIHNNDWYSFGGISFTWKMYNRLAGCPAYGEEDFIRKR